MPLIYLVRHGKAAASFTEAADPGLDDLGRSQAEAVATRWGERRHLGLLSSPLRRTRETAAPLAARWSQSPVIERRVAEIPSPPGLGLAERGPWLQAAMLSTWGALDPMFGQWRDGVVTALLALDRDTIVFSHFVAINAAAGAALGDDRMVVFRPDYCSETVVEAVAGRLRLISLGAEAETKVN